MEDQENSPSAQTILTSRQCSPALSSTKFSSLHSRPGSGTCRLLILPFFSPLSSHGSSTQVDAVGGGCIFVVMRAAPEYLFQRVIDGCLYKCTVSQSVSQSVTASQSVVPCRVINQTSATTILGRVGSNNLGGVGGGAIPPPKYLSVNINNELHGVSSMQQSLPTQSPSPS